MNKKGRRSKSKREEQIRRAYAPKTTRRRQESSIYKPSYQRRRSVLNRLKPGSMCEVQCYQELAYELISRELPEAIKEKHDLTSISYTGESFLLRGSKISQVVRAVNELTTHMWEFRPKSAELLPNTGTAQDLNNVTFREGIEFLGDSDCLFCGGSFEPGQKVRRTACLHMFHVQCIEPWLSSKQVCPIDKMPI